MVCRHYNHLKIPKITAVFLAILVLFSPIMPVLNVVFAANSPFVQTDWSGGSGQTNWSDNTKYDSASNAVTATAGQATITANTEKLSNTGFETDLTSWDTGGAFSDTLFSTASGAVAAWPLDDTTSTQSYSRVINPAVSTGREMIASKNLTSGWSVLGTGTIDDSNTFSIGASGGAGVSNTSIPTTIGKVFTMRLKGTSTSTTITVRSGSDTSTIYKNITVSGGVFDETFSFVSTGNGVYIKNETTNSSTDIDWSSTYIIQPNIPAYNATPTQLLSDGDMEASGTSSWTALNAATLTKETSSPYGGSRLLRITYGGTTNPYAAQTVLTSGLVYRITGYARGNGVANPRLANSSGTIIWTGTTSTTWQPFDVVFVADGTSVTLYSQNATSGNYVEYDSVVVSLDTGIRQGELLFDGDMEASGTSYWTTTNAATLTKQTVTQHGGNSGQVLQVARSTPINPGANQPILVVGKTYRVTGWFRGDGTVSPRMNAGGSFSIDGTSSTTWQYFDFTGVPTSNTIILYAINTTTSGQYTQFDDITVTEVNPLSGRPTNNVTLAATSSGHLTKAYNFDGTNDFINIYSSDLNSAFNPSEGTLVAWAEVSAANIWTNGNAGRIVSLVVDANNLLYIRRSATNNALDFTYSAGGSSKSVTSTSIGGSTDWFQVVLSWSKTDDQVKAYVNGAQVGSTQTGLGTWSGNLATTTAIIGALNTSGTVPWSGKINDVRLYNRALTSTEIAALYTSSSRDTSTTYNSTTGAAKVISPTDETTTLTQSVNVGDTNSYNLVAYAYTTGAAVTASDVSLYANGSTVSTTYTSVGSGWYRLNGTVTGVASSVGYGVQVQPGKTVYLDNFSLNNYASSATITSSIFDTGQGSAWGTLSYTVTTPTNTTVTIKARTSNDSGMSGATAFASCTAISSDTDISSNGCVSDTNRYIQYQATLTTSDLLNTPTLSDVSIAFSTNTTGQDLTLDSPGDNTYTSSERPSFRWLAATDPTSVNKYRLDIDNGDNGDFYVDNIPGNRTTTYETSTYVAKYEGFGDSDTTNNYISLYTKSSTDWSSDQNDGKLKEGKRTWTVSVQNTASNSTSKSRTIFADFSGPSITLQQVNGKEISNNTVTSSVLTPTLSGKVTDYLRGDSTANDIASGPINLEVRYEKLTGLGYSLVSLATVELPKTYWTDNDKEILDNSSQNADKYAPFTWTLRDSLSAGTYRVILTSKDKVGQTSSTSFTYTTSSYVVSAPLLDTKPDTAPQAEVDMVITPRTEPTKTPTPTLTTTHSPSTSSVSNFTQTFRNNIGTSANTIGKALSTLTGTVFNGLYTGLSWLGNAAGSTMTSTGKFISTTINVTGRGISSAITLVGRTIGHTFAITTSQINSLFAYLGAGYNHLASVTPGIIGDGMLALEHGFVTSTTAMGKTASHVSNSVTSSLVMLSTSTSHNINKVTTSIVATVSRSATNTTNTVKSGVATSMFSVGEKVQDLSDTAGYAIINFTYKFISEPTTISNVKAEILSPTSVKISWRTNHPANGKVNWGYEPGIYDFEEQTTKRTVEHEFILKNLKPNTGYHYEVMSQNGNYVYDANRQFTTPAK